jgi:hypothetical protein
MPSFNEEQIKHYQAALRHLDEVQVRLKLARRELRDLAIEVVLRTIEHIEDDLESGLKDLRNQ